MKNWVTRGWQKAQFQKVLKINPNYSDAAAVKKEIALLSAEPRERPQ
jgi:hypothetical protein